MEKRSIKADYLAGDPRLHPFISQPWRGTDWQAAATARAAVPVPRDRVAEVMAAQYAAHMDIPDGIAALRDPHALTVTTGHQVCLMGGPLFMLHKAATAIALARTLSRQLDRTVIPIFWMATEDHDWEEANHFYAGWGRKITAPGQGGGAVGRRQVDAALADLLARSTDSPLRAAYAPGRTWAQAFRTLLHTLFGQEGLLVLDGDDPALKRCFLPVMRAELETGALQTAVEAGSAALEAAAYPLQISTRPTNLFYLTDAARTRIDDPGGEMLTVGTETRSRASLLAELESHPERFSPNVALRPLYQETLLPNLAYVGGWAEIAYWMQLRQAFSQAQVPMPVLAPRMSAGWLTPAQAEDIAVLGLHARDFDQDTPWLYQRYMPRLWQSQDLEAISGNVMAAYETLFQYLDSLDPTLGRHARALQVRAQHRLEHLPAKAARSIRNRYPAAFREIDRLKSEIQPDRLRQERILNFTAFPVAPAAWAPLLLNALSDPLHYMEQWITLP